MLFKSGYSSSHGSSEAQLLCLHKGIKTAHEHEIVPIALPSPPKIIEAACALSVAACAPSTINVATLAPHLAACAPDLRGIFAPDLAAFPTLEMSAPHLAALSDKGENYSAGSKGGEYGAFVTIEKDFWELD